MAFASTFLTLHNAQLLINITHERHTASVPLTERVSKNRHELEEIAHEGTDGADSSTVAAREGVSLETVYRRLWQGQLDARKSDGRWLIADRSAEDTPDDTGVQGDHTPDVRQCEAER